MKVHTFPVNFVIIHILLLIFISATKSDSASPRNWPCPTQEAITPCICTESFGSVDLDCSGVQNEEELANALSDCISKFPFLNFRDFIIQHYDNENLTDLSPGILCQLSFQKIIISGTKLSRIQEMVFINSEDTVNTINLAQNLLSSFPYEILQDFSVLKNLDLTGNLLTLLPPLISQSLEVLHFSGNLGLTFPKNVFAGIPSLREVGMNYIGIDSLTTGVLNNEGLETVFLNDNEIEIVESGSIIGSKLGFVSLTRNNIHTVEVNAIQGMSSGGFVDLSYNQLKFLDENVWAPVIGDFNTSGTLNFHSNPIRCGCGVEWIFQGNNLNFIDSETTCYSGSPYLNDLRDHTDAFVVHCH